MMRFWTYLCLFLLITIHTADMLLTEQYVGNDWRSETFPLMKWAIQTYGIYGALWISRVIMYLYFWIALLTQDKKPLFYLLVIITILYYTSMIGWLFTLGYISWSSIGC